MCFLFSLQSPFLLFRIFVALLRLCTDSLGLQVLVSIHPSGHLGSDADIDLKRSLFDNCHSFLLRSAQDPAGAFQGAEFRKEGGSVLAGLAAPWRGWFPRRPLRYTVDFEVLGQGSSQQMLPITAVGQYPLSDNVFVGVDGRPSLPLPLEANQNYAGVNDNCLPSWPTPEVAEISPNDVVVDNGSPTALCVATDVVVETNIPPEPSAPQVYNDAQRGSC